MLRLSEDLLLKFMIPEHTKNVVYGTFGHLRRKMKTNNTRIPGEMLSIFEESSFSTKSVPSTFVLRLLCKDFMNSSFQFPAASPSQSVMHFASPTVTLARWTQEVFFQNRRGNFYSN